MKTHLLTLNDLASECVQAAIVSYNADGADSLSLTLKPDAYKDFSFSCGEKIKLQIDGRIVFSGRVASGVICSAQAGSGELLTVDAYSDFNTLEQISYCKQNSKGEVIYPSINKNQKFVKLSAFAQDVIQWAGDKIDSSFSCNVSRTIPSPEGNGATSCAQLLLSSLRWAPDCIVVQRYSESGNTLHLTTLDKSPHLSLNRSHLLTSVQLQEHPEQVPPVCALVGGDHFILPSDGDVREPGAFIYSVPLDNANTVAGAAAASQKMVIKGVPVPDKYMFRRGKAEYSIHDIYDLPNTEKFLKYFFPQYTAFFPYIKASACVITPVHVEELGETDSEEEDTRPPANYSTTLEEWSAGKGGIYVMTEGSFNASSNASKNVKGLRWCKANLTLNIVLDRASRLSLPSSLKPLVDELFPGKKNKGENTADFTTHHTAQLSMNAVLINRRRKVYDPATNKLCSSDGDFTEEEASLTPSDYRAILTEYYNNSRTVFTDGSISMLDNGSLQPDKLVGCSVTIEGKRAEWAKMNSIVRSVTWNLKERTIDLSVGGREVLGFSEQMERKLLSKQVRIDAARKLSIPFDVADDEADRENEMSVAPSVSSSVSEMLGGKNNKPFTLYEVFAAGEGDETTSEVWLAGGTLFKDGKTFNIADSKEQITRNEQNGEPWLMGEKVRLKWEKFQEEWKYSIFQKTVESEE